MTATRYSSRAQAFTLRRFRFAVATPSARGTATLASASGLSRTRRLGRRRQKDEAFSAAARQHTISAWFVPRCRHEKFLNARRPLAGLRADVYITRHAHAMATRALPHMPMPAISFVELAASISARQKVLTHASVRFTFDRKRATAACRAKMRRCRYFLEISARLPIARYFHASTAFHAMLIFLRQASRCRRWPDQALASARAPSRPPGELCWPLATPGRHLRSIRRAIFISLSVCLSHRPPFSPSILCFLRTNGHTPN